MNPTLTKTLKLGLITVVAAAILTVVNIFTAPIITELKLKQLNDTLSSLVSGEIENEQSIKKGRVLRSWDVVDNTEHIAVILELKASGFGGAMKILAAYNSSGEILNAALLENNETVGFGKNAEDPDYMTIFVGTGSVSLAVPTTKGKVEARGIGPIDMVVGSTITFSGISAALAEGASFIKGDL